MTDEERRLIVEQCIEIVHDVRKEWEEQFGLEKGFDVGFRTACFNAGGRLMYFGITGETGRPVSSLEKKEEPPGTAFIRFAKKLGY